jgi:gas vesicle protein
VSDMAFIAGIFVGGFIGFAFACLLAASGKGE